MSAVVLPVFDVLRCIEGECPLSRIERGEGILTGVARPGRLGDDFRTEKGRARHGRLGTWARYSRVALTKLLLLPS